MRRVTLRAVVAGFALYLGGTAAGLSWSFGVDLAVGVSAWLVFLLLVTPLLPTPLEEARKRNRALTAAELRGILRELEDPDGIRKVGIGYLAIILDTAAHELEEANR